MKKIITAAALAAAMSLPTTGFSQEVVNLGQLSSGANSISYGDTDGTCILLAETAKVNLSNSVSGAFRCSQAYGVARVATCHSAGSRTPTTVDCVFTPDPEGAAQITDPNTGLPILGDWNGTTCQQVEEGAPPMTFEVSSRRYYYAASSGGGVSLRALEDQVPCTSSDLIPEVQ